MLEVEDQAATSIRPMAGLPWLHRSTEMIIPTCRRDIVHGVVLDYVNLLLL